MKRSTLALITVFGVLIIDQLTKFWVKTHMYIGEEIPVFGNWFIINFVENEGMAFGLKLGGDYGKLILSIFRIIAVGAIGYYLIHLIKKQENKLFIALISLVFAGAMGNVIDGAFYGLIFSESYYNIAQFLPPEGGYSTFLHGKVVDMFYLPIIETTLPNWVPFWGGEEFIFFRPIFNVADVSISIAVILMIVFSKKLNIHFFSDSSKEDKNTENISSTDN